MDDEKLDLTNFKKALTSLYEALDEYRKDEANLFVRDSCIKRFEYCYDISKKILIKHLKNIGEEEIDNNSLADNIRLGAKKGILLHSWDVWDEYRLNRNTTSHGYDEKVAIKVVEKLNNFLIELEHLLDQLTEYYETQI
jgi:nucleotidyltransferase substrate binding protein (TIGR01987 family)